MEKRLCIKCNIPMGNGVVIYKELNLEAHQCPRCKEKIFTEQQTIKAVMQLEAQRIKKEYVKRPIKIGNSLGITFPKEVADVFGISTNMKIRIQPNIDKKIIKIIT